MDPPATPPPEAPSRLRLYRALQGSSRWFAERFAELRQEAERMLAAAAAKATDPVAARALADARAVFQREAPQLEHRWLAALARRIAAIAGDAAPRPERGPLALVEDGELEVALAIAPLTRQARRLCAEEWGALEEVFAAAFPVPPPDGLWPLDPAAVIAAFREATAELRPFDRDALLLLLDALGTSVLARLPELYRALLAELAGLLPGPRPRPEGEGQEPRRAPSQPALALWSRLEEMLGPPAAETAADAPTAELLHALSLLQGGEVAVSGGSGGSTLKPLLLKRLAGLRGGGVPRLRPRDERGIDLVGLVFELLLRDEAIPAAVRLVLARLQIPCVKAVLIDPGSLADPEAPPRRLIDLLAEAALGWCEDADRERRILARIEAAVDAVVRDFDEDLAVFARELESFRAFFAAEERRAEAAATRQLAAVRGRERLRAARARVSERIARLVGEADLPPRLRHLLFGPWAHYLVLLFLREGEDSAALREGFELAARLLAAASGEAPERLRGELPRIEAQLRHGLHAAAVHDHEIEALLAWLRGLAGLAPPTPLETSPPQAAAPLAPPFRSETQADTAAAAPDPATPSTALELGSWWLFREGERERRGRLVWQSPLDGRLLFLHQRGGVLAELEAASFAQACREGRVHPLPRAGSAIERALRQCEQRLGGAGAGARA